MKRILFLVLVLSALIPAASASAADYLRIFYYREGANARESLFAHPESIDILAPQTYGVNAEGELSGSLNPEVLDFAKKNKIKVMPLITNGAFSRSVAHAILDDRQKQDLAINQMVAEAKKQGYWGWQVDFEQMDASYKNKFSAFIKRMAREFKKKNLILSVAVVSKISDNPKDYKNKLWANLIGVFDYAALGKSADFISLMSYDDPDSRGPVARWTWLNRVLDYSLKKIPPKKLSLGIPFYYWEWSNQTGKLVEIGGRKGIYEVFSKYNAAAVYSIEQEAPYLTYNIGPKSYTLWYENDRSVAKKISLIKKHKLHGFSAWALGLELPTIYSVVN